MSNLVSLYSWDFILKQLSLLVILLSIPDISICLNIKFIIFLEKPFSSTSLFLLIMPSFSKSLWTSFSSLLPYAKFSWFFFSHETSSLLPELIFIPSAAALVQFASELLLPWITRLIATSHFLKYTLYHITPLHKNYNTIHNLWRI